MNARHPHFKEVMRQDAERERIGRQITASVKRCLAQLRIKLLKAAQSGEHQPDHIYQMAETLSQFVKRAMVVAHLTGRRRVLLDLQARPAVIKLDRYHDTVDFLKDKLQLPESDIRKLSDMYGHTARSFTKTFGNRMNTVIQQATMESIKRGEHVQASMSRVSKAMEDNGLSPQKPWLIETIVRTQTQVAYSAGRANGLRDPAIQQILWGFEYVTVGDDRVRPTHAAMDGVRRTKDDLVWHEWTPPCGWNCRCSQIPILHHEKAHAKETTVPQTIRKGKTITAVKPDSGFGIPWGKLYHDGISFRNALVERISRRIEREGIPLTEHLKSVWKIMLIAVRNSPALLADAALLASQAGTTQAIAEKFVKWYKARYQ